jgi:hypothetical protein
MLDVLETESFQLSTSRICYQLKSENLNNDGKFRGIISLHLQQGHATFVEYFLLVENKKCCHVGRNI